MFKQLKEVLKLLNSTNTVELADNIEANCPTLATPESIIEELLKLSWFITWIDWLKNSDVDVDLRDDKGRFYRTGALHALKTIKIENDTIEVNVGAKINIKPSLMVAVSVGSNDPIDIEFKSLSINYIKHVNSGVIMAENYDIDTLFNMRENIQTATIKYERLLSLYNGLDGTERAKNVVEDYTYILGLEDYSDDIKVGVGLAIVGHCIPFNVVTYDHEQLLFEYQVVPNEYEQLKKVHPSIINNSTVKSMISKEYDKKAIKRAINHSKLMGTNND